MSFAILPGLRSCLVMVYFDAVMMIKDLRAVCDLRRDLDAPIIFPVRLHGSRVVRGYYQAMGMRLPIRDPEYQSCNVKPHV